MANLLGRADATLVKAATDAAMANVPVDVSRIHERMMKSHERTMKSIGQSWVQGITGAMQIGGALVKQAQQNRKQLDAPHENYTDFEPLPETKEVISPPFEGGEEPAIIKQPTFKEWFIENNLKPENTGKSQSELKAQYDKENILVSTEEESSIVEYKHTDITGNTEIVKPKTIREHLKGIRKEYVSLGWRGDKDAINPATGIEWTKEEKKVRRDKLKGKRDKLKSSVVEFQTYSAVMKEQLADNNINITASDPVKMQFAQALLNEGKPLGEDAGKYAGSRAIMGFDKTTASLLVY